VVASHPPGPHCVGLEQGEMKSIIMCRVGSLISFCLDWMSLFLFFFGLDWVSRLCFVSASCSVSRAPLVEAAPPRAAPRWWRRRPRVASPAGGAGAPDSRAPLVELVPRIPRPACGAGAPDSRCARATASVPPRWYLFYNWYLFLLNKPRLSIFIFCSCC
jgi:hypothetical protein